MPNGRTEYAVVRGTGGVRGEFHTNWRPDVGRRQKHWKVCWKRKPFTPTRNQKKNGKEGGGNNVKEISILPPSSCWQRTENERCKELSEVKKKIKWKKSMNWCFCKTLHLFPPKTWLHLFAFVLQFLLKSFLCECITLTDRIFNVILWRVSDLTFLIAGARQETWYWWRHTLCQAESLPGLQPSVVCFLSCATRGGGGVTVIDKSCTGKVIYLNYTMKHHCMKTCAGSAPRNLRVNEDELSASRYGEFPVSGRLPHSPQKGMSAARTAVIQPVDSPVMAEYSRPVLW